MKKILILGGGFAGIKCARELSRKNLEDVKISLIDNKSYFEYHGALYRTATGFSVTEVCLPHRDTLSDDVDVLEDTVAKIDAENKVVTGISGSTYSFDTLVVALGAETNYFNIDGLKESAYGMKTINDALKLKRHLHAIFEKSRDEEDSEKVVSANIVIVGGGATGVELAGQMVGYAKGLAQKHGAEPSLVNIELVEAADRLLPAMSSSVSKKVEKRLRKLGVKVLLSRSINKSDTGAVYFEGTKHDTKTVIWTAGVRANHLVEDAGIEVDKRGRASVDANLRTKKFPHIYVCGDAANTKRSGMAQTALYDGVYIANCIQKDLQGKSLPTYHPPAPIYVIPVGDKWSGVIWGPIALYGRVGWIGRRLVDSLVYALLLSPSKALNAFLSHGKRESCERCQKIDEILK